jgi:hypothetical protein
MNTLENLVLAKYEAAAIGTSQRALLENLLKEAGLLVESNEVSITSTTTAYRTKEELNYSVSFKPRKNAKFAVIGIYADGTAEVVRQSESYRKASDASYSIGSAYDCPFAQVVMHEIRKPLVASKVAA